MRITKRLIDGLQSAEKDRFVWDDQLRGFGVKVTPSGKKVYVVQYRLGGRAGTSKRATIGQHGPWDVASARLEAEQMLHAVHSGQDPIALKRAKLADVSLRNARVAELEFATYVDTFLRLYASRKWRPRTYSSAESNLRRWIKPVLTGKSLPELRRSDIVVVFDRLPPDSPALPRNLFALMRRLFSWAVQRGDLEQSPMKNMEVPEPVRSRDRILSDDELMQVALNSTSLPQPFGALIRMLILTGQRRGEVAGMRWDELDRAAGRWTLPHERVKNKRNHSLPLNAIAIRSLDNVAGGEHWPTHGLVFTTTGRSPVSGYSKIKDKLDQLIAEKRNGVPLAPWRLHDLRRTFATNMQRLGVRFEVTEALLNHVGESRAGVAGVYQRHDWSEEKRVASDLWAAHLTALIDKLGAALQQRDAEQQTFLSAAVTS